MLAGNSPCRKGLEAWFGQRCGFFPSAVRTSRKRRYTRLQGFFAAGSKCCEKNQLYLGKVPARPSRKINGGETVSDQAPHFGLSKTASETLETQIFACCASTKTKLPATISFAIPFFVIPCVPAFLLQIMTHPQAPPPPLCRASAGSGTPLCTFPSSAGLGCGAQRLLEAGEVHLCQGKMFKIYRGYTSVTPDEFGEPWSISGKT